MFVLKRLLPVRFNYPKMLVNSLVIVTSAMYFSFDMPYKYVVYSAFLTCTLIINFSTIKKLLRKIFDLVSKLGKKRGNLND